MPIAVCVQDNHTHAPTTICPYCVHHHHRPSLVGQRVVGEINCRDPDLQYTHADPVMVRNHAPGRTVLGIIGRHGVMAEYCSLPAENLYIVPDDISDAEAAFAEPLAAACRIVEQQVVGSVFFCFVFAVFAANMLLL